MKTKKSAALVLLLSLSVAAALRSQESDTVKLDPFTVSDTIKLDPFMISAVPDRGYVPQFAPAPGVAVTLRKPATGVLMELALTNNAEKAETRNRELYATIEQIEKAVATSPGLRLEKREIQLRGEARQRTLFSRNGAVTSLANVAIIADLGADLDLFATVKQIRTTLATVAAVGSTKIADGPVSFVLKDLEQYRQELLTRIFADLDFVKKGVGQNFEVLPTGLDGAIQSRPASEKEVELWIQYRFSIRSLTELQNPKPRNS